MEPWLQTALTIAGSVVASSGFWAFLQARREKKDAKTELLVGLAHDRILFLGLKHIEKGYITQDEYENLHTYLFEPYKRAGGNGSVKRVMQEVDRLPIRAEG